MRVRVHSEDFERMSEEIYEIAACTAAGVEDAHTRRDPAPEELVEQVDIDVAELL
jgi:hypothetical protein